MRLLELFALIDEIKYFLTHLLAVYLLLINFAILNYPRIFQIIYIQLYNLKLLNLCYNAIYLIYANILCLILSFLILIKYNLIFK